jgi:hypothetical protein
MHALTISGLYRGHSALIRVDARAPVSLLSPVFAHLHSVPQTVENSASNPKATCSGPICVPVLGGYYLSSLPLLVSGVVRCDLLLGQDWLQSCRPTFSKRGLVPNLSISLPSGLQDC